MNEKPQHVLRKFGEKSEIIAHLMEEDGEFHALCEDYDACVDALRYWAKSKEPEAETRLNEYRNLVRELEDEIGEVLAASEPGGLD